MPLRFRAFFLALVGCAIAVAAACGGDTDSKDASVALDATADDVAHEDGAAHGDDTAHEDAAHGCVYPASTSSFCTLCKGDWYCPDGTRTVACPTTTYGNSCDYDSGSGYCLACLSYYSVMASCTCIHNPNGNYGGDDGGVELEDGGNLELPDGGEAPLTWNCIDTGEACVPQ